MCMLLLIKNISVKLCGKLQVVYADHADLFDACVPGRKSIWMLCIMSCGMNSLRPIGYSPTPITFAVVLDF